DVKVGHHVSVVYELPGHSPVARAIEQTSATFVGTLDAIDTSARRRPGLWPFSTCDPRLKPWAQTS
ncbi:MAG TPA: hypothetical protein VK579_10860, partial [Terriglobales bacterium]|nr:hypothetical protein [Terriglobales bacterium]